MDVQIPCICPPKGDETRHPDGDTVTLRETLGFQSVVTLRYAVQVMKSNDPDASIAQILGVLSEHYILAGVEAWTVVDEKGKPAEVTPAALRERLLPNLDAAMTVADVADSLYLAVMLPLLNRVSTSSPPSPTSGSTSPTTGSSDKLRKQSKPSSISTIRTAATEATSSSLVGVSSSSQSSESAA
jgi:hypothetical protein